MESARNLIRLPCGKFCLIMKCIYLCFESIITILRIQQYKGGGKSHQRVSLNNIEKIMKAIKKFNFIVQAESHKILEGKIDNNATAQIIEGRRERGDSPSRCDP